MINADGFLDWAMRLPRHPDKVYSQRNTGEWITVHSIVGKLGTGQVPARFLSDERVPGQPDRFINDAAASVMFILYEDGTLGQCYPITASTWTSGGQAANTRSWAIEAAGGAEPNTREKLTVPAEDTFIRLVREWEAWSGKKAVPGVHIRQHKDVAKEFGYPATACASDRYSGAEARLVAEEAGMVTRVEFDALKARLDAIQDHIERTTRTDDFDSIEAWKRRGNVGSNAAFRLEQDSLAKLASEVAALAETIDDYVGVASIAPNLRAIADELEKAGTPK